MPGRSWEYIECKGLLVAVMGKPRRQVKSKGWAAVVDLKGPADSRHIRSWHE